MTQDSNNTAAQEQKLQAVTRRLDRYASLLDNRFRVPGTQIRFGWDALIGLIPGIGDTIALLFSGVILVEAKRIGAPKRLLLKMAANMGLEWAVGIVPILGDLFDVYWKANIRNMALLKDHLHQENHKLTLEPAPYPEATPDRGWYWGLIIIGGLFLYLVYASLQQIPW